jgi:hypothetical protein
MTSPRQMVARSLEWLQIKLWHDRERRAASRQREAEERDDMTRKGLRRGPPPMGR